MKLLYFFFLLPTPGLPPTSIFFHFKELLRRSKQQITDVVNAWLRDQYIAQFVLCFSIQFYYIPETFMASLKSCGVASGLSDSSVYYYVVESGMLRKWSGQLQMYSDIKSSPSVTVLVALILELFHGPDVIWWCLLEVVMKLSWSSTPFAQHWTNQHPPWQKQGLKFTSKSIRTFF